MTKEQFTSQANDLLKSLATLTDDNKVQEFRAISAVASQLLKDYAPDNVFTEVLLHYSKHASEHTIKQDEYDSLLRAALLYYF